MNKFKLTIDVDKINLENEAHVRNFSQKIKNLAQHCVNYINGIDNKTDCTNKRFLPEIHDDDNDSTIDSHYAPPTIKPKKMIKFKVFNAGNSLILTS